MGLALSPSITADDWLVPASSAQSRTWFLEQWLPGTSQYHLGEAWRVTGPLSILALEAALGALLVRHESLRTGFMEEAGEPRQRILEQVPFAIAREDLSALEGAAREAALREALASAYARPFDLAKPPLLRMHVWQLDAHTHVLLLVVHHIVSDGWSQGVLKRELGESYACALRGADHPLEPLPLQYADYALWQREQTAEASHRDSLQWWTRKLENLEPAELPTDRPRGAIQDLSSGLVAFHLDETLTDALKRLARASGATLYMVLLAGLQALIMRLSGRSDVVVGSPMAGRSRPELEGLIGFFANTLVLRGEVDRQESFGALVERVREATLDALGHAEVQFEEIVRALNPPRDPSRHPLFQIMLALQNVPQHALELADARLAAEPVPRQTTKFEWSLMLAERAGRLEGWVEYATALFDAATVERTLGHFRTLLAAAAAAPETPTGRLPLLTPAEREALAAWNANRVVFGEVPSLHGGFEARVRRHPEAPALIFGEEVISYGELDARADRVARALRSVCAADGIRIGICLAPSPDLVVGVLAILKAGGAYVPLDPGHPPARLARLAEGAALSLLVVEEGTPALPVRTMTVTALEAMAVEDAAALPRVSAEALAYVIHTSGSTGEPKGVMVSHGAIGNHMAWMCAEFGFGPIDRVMFKTNLASDASVWEVFAPLWSGACMVIAPAESRADPARLARLIRAQGVTVLQMVPSLLNLMLAENLFADLPSLGKVYAGGEILTAAMVEAFMAQSSASLYNLYGPTECAVDATFWRCTPGLPDPLPIGCPIANTEAWVLDAGGECLPAGVPGELYLGGACLAQGYLGRPDLTAERFVAHPWQPDARLYRTGDRVRWRADGTLECLGRIDAQIKLRGYRIEPAEIESVLLAQPGVTEAAVLLREDHPGDPRLIAYLAGDAAHGDEIQDALARILPDYMVPGVFVFLTHLPRMPNGKLDRKTLPAPAPRVREAGKAVPMTATEQALAAIWETLLGVKGIARDDNFFSLGGHSLMVIRLLSRIRARWAREIAPRDVFDHPTLASLAGYLVQGERDTPPQPAAFPIPASASDSPAPAASAQLRLWYIERQTAGTSLYHIAEAWQLDGQLDLVALRRAFEILGARHAALRTIFEAREDELLLHERPAQEVPFESGDLSTLDAEAQASVVEALMESAVDASFDLEKGPLWRVRVWQRGPRDFLLLWVVHHLVTDGWSQTLLHAELGAAYAAALRGESPREAPLPCTYADYARWQRARMDSAEARRNLDWWVQRLANLPSVTLPGDRSPAPEVLRPGARQEFVVPAALAAQIRACARDTETSAYMVLLAGFKLLLARYSGELDVVVGTAVAGRGHEAFEPLVGMFVNTLVLRTDLGEVRSFTDVLERVRDTVLEAQAHGETPFEDVVRAINPVRQPGRNPLFQVMFVCQERPSETLVLEGVTALPFGLERAQAKFDLTLSFFLEGDCIRGVFEFARDLFAPETVARLAAHQVQLLETCLAAPEASVPACTLMGAQERALIRQWSTGVATTLAPGSLMARVAHHVHATPQATALVDEEGSLSYEVLAAEADSLAAGLVSAGVRPGSHVAICLPRSREFVVAILAVLRAGAAYVPLDPTWPDARIMQILTACACPLVLAEDARMRLAELHPNVCAFDALQARGRAEEAPLPEDPGGNALAYVMFTSGSTGAPKGVLVEQRSILRLVDGQDYAFFGPEEVFLLLAPMAFDASTFEIWGPLLTGGKLVIYPDTRVTAAGLEAVIARHGVTTLWLTATLFNAIIDERPAALRGLRQLLTGGEALSPAHVRRALAALPGVRLINGYGPTESTTFACCHLLEAPALAECENVPIGRPLAHTEAWVLDEDRQLVPPGIEGELYLGGEGVARGYLDDPALTDAHFVPHPWRIGARLYRTGDRARWRENGLLEFRGRRDDQIKLRGYRIEPAEIDQALLALPGVHQAAVIARQTTGAGLSLTAYVVGEDLVVANLRQTLRTRVPDYMMPTDWCVLDALPLTPNGKLDRKALPEPRPAEEPSGPRQAGQADVIERHLIGLWETLFGRTPIDPDAAFLELGGHSLLAVRLLDAVERSFGVRLPLDLLWLEDGSIRTIARRLRDRQALAPWPILVPLRQGGDHPPLFCVHTIGGNLFHYFPLARALPDELPVFGLQARGLEGIESPRASVRAIAADCVRAIHAAQPHGPCRVVGYSSGGVVAWEIAHQLRAQGREVALLGLVDTYAPGVRRRQPGDSVSSPHLRLQQQRSALSRWVHAACGRLSLTPPGGFPDVAAAHWWAHAHYRLRPYEGMVDLFLTEVSRREATDPCLGWQAPARGGLAVHLLPGDHAALVKAPLVDRLAERLSERLRS